MLRELVRVRRRDLELARSLRDLVLERALVAHDLRLRLGEALRHVVERVRQEPQLVARARGYVDVEPAARDRARGAHQPPHRRDEPPGEQQRRDHRDEHHQPDDRQPAGDVGPESRRLGLERHADLDVADRPAGRRRRIGPGRACRERASGPHRRDDLEVRRLADRAPLCADERRGRRRGDRERRDRRAAELVGIAAGRQHASLRVEDRDVGDVGARRERRDHLLDRATVARRERLVDDLGEHRRERERLRAQIVLAAGPFAPERVGGDRQRRHEDERDRQDLDLREQAEPHGRQARRRDGLRRERRAVLARAAQQASRGACNARVRDGPVIHRRGRRSGAGAGHGTAVSGIGIAFAWSGRAAATPGAIRSRCATVSSEPGHRSNPHAMVPDAGPGQAVTTGIFPIRARHSRGPVSCTDAPLASTATVTGMSRTSNS